MKAEEKIKRISKLLNDSGFVEATQEELFECIDVSTIADIKKSMWQMYCFMSDVCDTLNM